MKKLLGIIGILALATALLPAQGYADLRGAFAPLAFVGADGTGFANGFEQGSLRPVDADGIMITGADAGGRIIEEWFTFSTRSLTPGNESIRSIWIHWTSQQSGYSTPLLKDPSEFYSYFDPAWSSDGRFLAYVRVEGSGGNQTLFVQEYFVNDDFEASHGGSYPDGEGAESAVGPAILVSSAGNPRHPDWSPTGHTLAFDSNVAGTADIYTSDIDISTGTAGAPIRRTFVDNKAETDPAWAPNGHDIAYVTNKFGPKIIEILDLNLPSSDAAYLRFAERNFVLVTHGNPDWTSDGGAMYYDAPTGEDPSGVSNVWRLDLATQGKCEIQFDATSDADPNVSGIVNFSAVADGHVPFNYFVITSQGGGLGLGLWKVNPLHSCLLPLAMGVATVPAVLDPNDETTENFKAILNFPPETRAAGFRMHHLNAGSVDGVRLRSSILNTPALMGLGTPATSTSDADGISNSSCFDSTAHGLTDSLRIWCNWPFRDIVDRVAELGLNGSIIPMKVTAFSNIMGRGFQGFAYVRLAAGSGAAPVALLGSSPNPFNPVTKLKFSVTKPGTYALRLYSVQGALIRTVANQHYEAGTHEAMWDGRTNGGGMAASGVYYAKISGAIKGVGSEGMKLVLQK